MIVTDEMLDILQATLKFSQMRDHAIFYTQVLTF